MSTQSAPADPVAMPLFYRQPEILSAAHHGGWKLLDGDTSFASETASVPLLASEIGAASAHYPIVFVGPEASPVAIVGLDRLNLFVVDGRWTEGVYIPAYVRRYPFGFVATVNPSGFALAIDVASERVSKDGEAGAPLFEDGAPSALTRQAMDFCSAFNLDAVTTRMFAEELKGKGVLVDRRADATLPDGTKLGLHGFHIIDREKFAALDDAVILEWHHAGILPLVYFHLASLNRFSDLLARQAARLEAKSSPAVNDKAAAKPSKKKA